MTEEEFISHWVGKPYRVRGNDESGIDCWALVVRYYLDVLGVELDDACDDDIAQGFEREIKSGAWLSCDKKDAGVVFMAFDNSGEPRHVGIVVGGGELILHARHTRVQCDRIGIIRRHRLEFYRHVDNRYTAKEDSPNA
ncbi:MAG: NlpC/P60 family protein [Aeromonadaceae bacterium]